MTHRQHPRHQKCIPVGSSNPPCNGRGSLTQRCKQTSSLQSNGSKGQVISRGRHFGNISNSGVALQFQDTHHFPPGSQVHYLEGSNSKNDHVKMHHFKRSWHLFWRLGHVGFVIPRIYHFFNSVHSLHYQSTHWGLITIKNMCMKYLELMKNSMKKGITESTWTYSLCPWPHILLSFFWSPKFYYVMRYWLMSSPPWVCCWQCSSAIRVLCWPWIQQLMKGGGKGTKPLPVQPGPPVT